MNSNTASRPEEELLLREEPSTPQNDSKAKRNPAEPRERYTLPNVKRENNIFCGVKRRVPPHQPRPSAALETLARARCP